MAALRVLTWHIHGNYLLYLSQAPVEMFLPVGKGLGEGYSGRGTTFPFGPNVHDIPANVVRDASFDCILFQTRKNYEIDQYTLLSPEQRRLPRIFLQHDPPCENPTDQKHWVDDPNVLLVHVTPFNALMFDNGRTPTRVIEHGVVVSPDIEYSGEIEKGLVVINHLRGRGRRLGADVFEQVRKEVPLELVGMDSESLGGFGEVFPPQLPAFESQYRFFFNPIRYTSLGLAVIEAMMVGMPIVGLATTEMVTTIRSGESGFLDTDPSRLIEPMRLLFRDRGEARRMGTNARRTALERFHIDRFAEDWRRTFDDVVGRRAIRTAAPTEELLTRTT
jgi:glycosyltransferase involved in cell wall biosynthesis